MLNASLRKVEFRLESLKLRTVSAELARWDDDFALEGGISRSRAGAKPDEMRNF